MKNIFYIVVLMILLSNIINAQPLPGNCVEVQPGWNLVGALCSGDLSDSDYITYDPPGNLDGYWFGYSGGYFQATNLVVGKGYWVKVYAAGTICFSCADPIPSCDPPTVVHPPGPEGKEYHTVMIGTQCWLRENLDIGEWVLIGGQQPGTEIEKYCYDNYPYYCQLMGGLYEWDEAMQYSTGAQGICPTDWHIPTYLEFQTLSANVGGDGNAMKMLGHGTGAGEGTNTSGFSALLVGYSEAANFLGLGSHSLFWSSTESGSYAHYLGLFVSNSTIFGMSGTVVPKSNGYSVRCIRD